VGSSKEDLKAFPEAVQDDIGTAFSVAQFGGILAPSPREGRGREFSKWWKIIAVTPVAQYT